MTKRRDLQARFHERYSAPAVEAQLLVDREVIGADVGANGYTTVVQADLLAGRLGLSPEHLLLDIGSGRGWPGLYLAAQAGCRAVLLDLPLPALQSAASRAHDQGVDERVSIVRGGGTHLPFTANSFDAISHTDTL